MTAQSTGDAKYIVYTAIFGDYDSLREPRVLSTNVRFMCFTDNPNVRSNAWEIVHIESAGNCNRLNRQLKLNPHLYLPPHDYSLYVDGNVRIVGYLDGFFGKYARLTEVAAPRHFARNCLYEEAKACIRSGKGDASKIRELMEGYRQDGFPTNAGLFEMNIMFRRTFSDDVIRLMEHWWSEYQKGAGRDQISFPFAAWRSGVPIATLEESPRYTQELFRLEFHNAERRLPFFKKAVLYARLNRQSSFILRTVAEAADRIASIRSK